MSDLIPAISWNIGARDGSPSGRFLLTWGRRPLEELLWEAIRQNELQPRLADLFQVTCPLWYAFWMDSPLSSEQGDLLHDLLLAVAAMPDCWPYHLDEFLRALAVAQERRLPIYVDLAAPGHSDFGWTTIFPHCPRCKAEAPLPRWQESYPKEPIRCPVCETEYSPAATHSSERDYHTTSVVCSACQAKYPVRGFSEAEKDLLEKYHRFQEAMAELAMLRRVEDFYRRYPHLEGKIRPQFLDVLKSKDPDVREQLMADTPLDRIRLRENAVLPDSEQFSGEDQEVIDYLRHNYFVLRARLQAVTESVSDLKPIVEADRVACPNCGGELR